MTDDPQNGAAKSRPLDEVFLSSTDVQEMKREMLEESLGLEASAGELFNDVEWSERLELVWAVMALGPPRPTEPQVSQAEQDEDDLPPIAHVFHPSAETVALAAGVAIFAKAYPGDAG
jgi:hypothetical protein